MTDRIQGFTVVMDNTYREDDIEPLREAMLCMRGVVKVVPIVADPHSYIAASRARAELKAKVLAALEADRD